METLDLPQVVVIGVCLNGGDEEKESHLKRIPPVIRIGRISSIQFTIFPLPAHPVTIEREKSDLVLCIHSYFSSVTNMHLRYYYGFKGDFFFKTSETDHLKNSVSRENIGKYGWILR